MVCRILNIPISRLGLTEAVNVIQKWRGGGAFYFVNVHLVVEAQSNAALNEALQNSSLNFADGVPLVWSSKLKKEPISSRVCGPDFMTEILKRKIPSAIIGGRVDDLKKIESRFPGSITAVYSPPYRPFDPENVGEDLEQLRSQLPKSLGGKLPRFIWVGLGAPKQELWIQKARSLEPDCLFFGIGAAIDFLAGSKPRAPLWMQRMGLEWLFRLLTEPKRLWKRYMITNTKFIILSFREWVGI